MSLRLAIALSLIALAGCGSVSEGPVAPDGAIPVVAAESLYGDVVAQVGAGHVRVASILSDPSLDPHLYEASVDDARSVSAARLVVLNGLGYDAFLDKILAASPRRDRTVIVAARLVDAPQGANPHLWYEPNTVTRVAQAVAASLIELQPSARADFEAGLERFNASLQPVRDEIAAIKARHAGAKVLPTEPVFDYMAGALGFEVVDRDGAFQKAVEEGADPPAEAVAGFRRQLASRQIKALIYNSQAETPMTTQMQALARQNQVPVVGVTETLPPGKTFQQWQLEQLRQLRQALES